MRSFPFIPSTLFTLACVLMFCTDVSGQTDSTYVEEEIDWSLYDEVEYADESARRYCSSKIIGISPQQFIFAGYDFQGPYQARFSP
ncbi:MAG: hypothetical protein NWR72_01475, partial [Bacteroidia bacterium]|nr:hypothetical protein [Bacteroidia bacterium]